MPEIRATGRVTRIYTRDSGTNFRLDVPAELQPKDRYFHLALTHPNYTSLYSLALSAAVNGYQLQIRTTDFITADEVAGVEYMVVDW